MASKLSEIITQYNTFEDNQVLTKDQLNVLISYFEVQDRLSRIFLSGVGIVCGFKLKFNSISKTITISQGTGITTDGDLIKLLVSIPESKLNSFVLDEILYTRYRSFEDKSAKYNSFKRLVNPHDKKNFTPIELIEIVTEDTPNAKPLSNLPDLNKKVVLLYLDSYPKNVEPCTSIDCNNQGKEQVATLRVLLVSKKDAIYIENADSIFSKHNTIDSYSNLPDVALQRVVLNEVNTANYSKLKTAYYNALTSEDLTSNLTDCIKLIANNFKSVLRFDFSNDTLDTLTKKVQSITKLNQHNLPLNIQYRYDFIKDVIDTYNEIKSLLLLLKEECCPDIKAFPKHLLLGNLDEVDEPIKHNRHSFYKSPIVICGSNKIEHCRSLVLRLFEMIKTFNSSQTDEIKITPSNKLVPLSFRSIPYYYEVQNKLLETWNYLKTEKLEQGTNLSYHTSLLSNLSHIKKPLKYNLDKFDFYRIEGHLGTDYRKAFEVINQLKIDNGLAFDVKVLSVDVTSDNLNIDDYLCEFEDLYVLLRAWTAEQECILSQVSSFFSAFSTSSPGVNVKETEYSIGKIPAESTAKTARTADKAKSATGAFAAGNDYKMQAKAIDTAISDSLTTEENTLGVIMQVVLTENKGYPVEDLIAKAKYLVEGKVSTGEWIGKTDIKTFVIDQSIELMATIHVLSQQIPQSISEMTSTGLTAYKLTMDKLCSIVKKIKARYESLELSNELKTFMGLLVNQLSSVCCSSKKLDILVEEINKRKERILTMLQLSAFVEKNPGLEHFAGVQPGGTFVLVYLNKTESVLNDEIAIIETNDSEIKYSIADYRDEITTKETKEVSNLKIDKTKNERTDFVKNATTESVNRLDDFGKAASSVSLPKYTVVADFSLPYLCCSNCSPVNFIIQKPTVSLRLGNDTCCLGKDTTTLLFEVTPEDGIIKGDPEVAGMIIEGKQLTLNPDLFPNEMLGKPIGFTVNDQATTCMLTVFKVPQFDFAVPESPTTQTEIKFVPTGNLEGATYYWSFGDGDVSIESTPTHTYTLPVNDKNTVIVSLTVKAANGLCPGTVQHEIVFKEMEIDISLPKNIYCEKLKTPQPFTITPAGIKAKIEGDGVVPSDAGGYAFIPSSAGIGINTFTVNGKPATFKVTVVAIPQPAFAVIQEGNKLILTNESTAADSFIWHINGEEFPKSDNSPMVIDLTANSPTIWVLALEAISKVCGSVMSDKIEFRTKPIAENCVEKTTVLISIDKESINLNTDIDEKLRELVLYPTIKLYEQVLSQSTTFLDGTKNAELGTLFSTLLRETTSGIVNNFSEGNAYIVGELSKLYILQIKLFYNVLHCQTSEMIEKNIKIILSVLSLIETELTELRASKIFFDSNGVLLSYLEEYSKLTTIHTALKEHVTAQIALIK